ncbi:uncharacterized protein Culd [Tribolium castaneum]|uniref:uncharacterized protein Culd n=1 Tax=Tribolium castaneum TaxID=7070 RepID=UPI0030FE595E
MIIDLCKTKTFSYAEPNQITIIVRLLLTRFPPVSKDMSATNQSLKKTLVIFLLSFHLIRTKFLDDICGHINGQRLFLDHGETGTLQANYSNNIFDRFYKNKPEKRCTVELVSCPSCVIKITFTFFNLICGRSFDTCACDHVWIYEPTFEQSSQQFCRSSNTSMVYQSQTRRAMVVFLYSQRYENAFSLDYMSNRNKVVLNGNGTQMLQSPFFPNLYPSDLTMEYTIGCKSENDTCKISLVFTDFLIAPPSILDFFDSSGDRIYVTTGNIFRPPVITSGSALVIRFYANGATSPGFKAYYSFINDVTNIDCGGQVNNLGGGITMMDMVQDGLKSFDCIWLVKPPETYLHMKTHLYVKVVNFSGFAGSTELTIRQGLTSNGPVVENLKLSLPLFYTQKKREHIVPISQGFYIRLKGFFSPQSRLAIVYAAFNYKDCLSGSDFLCHNKRCVSSLLNCDGFDHCGDNSDESSISCSKDPNDRRQWSQTPHFLFPKVSTLSDFATSTLVFLLCSFGLMGFIFAMVVLLYRINIKSRHQRQIQDHIETINAILEEGVVEIEEEIIIPDDPPDYEAPPDYDQVVKCFVSKRCSKCRVKIPESPPPAYNQGPSTSRVLHFFANRKCYRGRRVRFLSDSECDQKKSRGFLRKSFTADDMTLFI